MAARAYDQPYRGLPLELQYQVYACLFHPRVLLDSTPHHTKDCKPFKAWMGGQRNSGIVYEVGLERIPFAIFLANKEMSGEALDWLYSKSVRKLGQIPSAIPVFQCLLFTNTGSRFLDFHLRRNFETDALELHPNHIKSFFLRIPKSYRQAIKHVKLSNEVFIPKQDEYARGRPKPLLTEEGYMDQTASLLRFLARHLNLATLTVGTGSLILYNQMSMIWPLERDGHPLFQSTSIEVIRVALLHDNLTLQFAYDTKPNRLNNLFYIPGHPYAYKTFPHCVALTLTGVVNHPGPCTPSCQTVAQEPDHALAEEDAGLTIGWKLVEVHGWILVVRKRGPSEAKIDWKACRALSDPEPDER